MASIRTRQTRLGTTYQVLWRQGGVQTSATAESEKQANSIKALVEQYGYLPEAFNTPARGQATVADLLEHYFADRERRHKSDRTVQDYRRDAARWIIPVFGHLLASTVEDYMVQEWVDEIPRAAKTVANIHGILSGAYKWGSRRKVDGVLLVAANPCSGTELPERQRKVRGLRAGEWAILYQAACQLGRDASDPLLFLVGTGWRWSEMAAAQVWQADLDGDKPLIEMAQVFRRGADNRMLLVDDAKSEAGHLRKVRLSPMVATMLRERVEGKALGDFIFTSPEGTPLRYSNFHRRVWARPATGRDAGGVLARATALGLRAEPTLHWLRHTQAALLIESGANLPAIQRRLGHESISTTVDTYGQLVDDVGDDVLGALDRELFRVAARRVDLGG